MFKSAVLASVVILGGFLSADSSASAGHPSFCAPHYGGFHHSHRSAFVSPYYASRVGFGSPFIGPVGYGSGFGYGYPGYRSYRPGIGVGGFGGYPYGFGSGFGGFNPYLGGNGVSLFIGR
jgi:hypothetical protein